MPEAMRIVMLFLLTPFSISSSKGGRSSLSGHALVISVTTMHAVLFPLTVSESFLEFMGFKRALFVAALTFSIEDFSFGSAMVSLNPSGTLKKISPFP